MSAGALEFRLGSGKVASLAERLEASDAMLAVAEGLVAGETAAAKGDDCPAGEAELFSFRVDDNEVAFDADGSILDHRDFCG